MVCLHCAATAKSLRQHCQGHAAALPGAPATAPAAPQAALPACAPLCLSAHL